MLRPIPDARGHYTVGKELVDNVIDRIRRVAGQFFFQYPSLSVILSSAQTIAPPSKGSSSFTPLAAAQALVSALSSLNA